MVQSPMTELTHQSLQTLTELSRIHCTQEEEAALLIDLRKLLRYVEQLNEVDTNHVEPCFQVLEGVVNVDRNDEVKDLLPRQLFLDNAPDQMGGMIKVPPIMILQE